MALSIQETKEGVLFKAIIQPRSSKNMIFGIEGDSLKIKLTASPVKGAANKLCVKFLTSVLKVPPSDIEIVRGQHRRKKKILVHSVTRKYLESKLFLSKAGYSHPPSSSSKLMRRGYPDQDTKKT